MTLDYIPTSFRNTKVMKGVLNNSDNRPAVWELRIINLIMLFYARNLV